MEELLLKLNEAAPPAPEVPQYFVAGNMPQAAQQVASRLAKAQAPLPTVFSINYAAGAASVLIFGSSLAFAGKFSEISPENSMGILIVDIC